MSWPFCGKNRKFLTWWQDEPQCVNFVELKSFVNMTNQDDPRVAPTVLMFGPDTWGQIDRFSKLCGGTYAFCPRDNRALSGVSAHLEKALIFKKLAKELVPALEIDRAELKENGYTPAQHARRLAAVIEAFVAELYSSIDCAAKVLRAVLINSTRGFRKSTSFLFTNTEKIEGLPQPVLDAITNADWYLPLRYLRDELTHLAVGTCSMDDNTGLVRYMHVGMKRDGKPLIYDDVLGTVQDNFNAVNLFLGKVFHFLVSTLTDTPVELICGMTEGRILMRRVVPTELLTFDSGICLSHQWFEQPENPSCPFVTNCGAYARTKGF